jgi:hypothetical protein
MPPHLCETAIELRNIRDTIAAVAAHEIRLDELALFRLFTRLDVLADDVAAMHEALHAPVHGLFRITGGMGDPNIISFTAFRAARGQPPVSATPLCAETQGDMA